MNCSRCAAKAKAATANFLARSTTCTAVSTICSTQPRADAGSAEPGLFRADERPRPTRLPRYTSSTSSAVHDSLRKHSPCPLLTTTGVRRKPGVQVRLVAGSPTASKRPHLNPGFKVVSQASPLAEDFPIPGLRNPAAPTQDRARLRAWFFLVHAAAISRAQFKTGIRAA